MNELQKLKEFVEEQIARIEAEPLHNEPPALIQINAPVALIQCELRGELRAYRRMLAFINVEFGGKQR